MYELIKAASKYHEIAKFGTHIRIYSGILSRSRKYLKSRLKFERGAWTSLRNLLDNVMINNKR